MGCVHCGGQPDNHSPHCRGKIPTVLEKVQQERDDLLEVLEDLLGVPMWVDEATVPAGKSPDDAPDQVVVNMAVAWARIQKARRIIKSVGK